MRRVTLEVAFTPSGQGDKKGQTLALTWIFPGQSLVVGRSKGDAGLALQQDGSISKRHFELAFDGTQCTIRDLDTTNGTFVNGQKVTETALQDGDTIEAGKTRFTLGIVEVPDVPDSVDIDGTVAAPARHALPPDQEDPAQDEVVPIPEIRASQSEFGFVTLAVTEGPFVSVQRDELSRQLVWIRAGQSIRVGRSVWEADWVIPADPMISGLHFEIVFDGSRCQIKDLNSSNGTFVNGEQVRSAELKSGDAIRAGETTFELQFS